MKFDAFSRIPIAARRALIALAVITGFSMATPASFASIALSWSATEGASTASGTGTGFLNVGPTSVGNFSLSITTNTADPSGTGLAPGNGTSFSAKSSQMSSTTFTLNNDSTTSHTLDIVLSGTGFTVAGHDLATFSVSGSSSAYTVGKDTTTDTSSINGTAIQPSGGLIGVPVSNGTTTSYSWTPGASSSSLSFTNASTFSIGQTLDVTLGANDSVTLTINTTVVPTPEPSTMAIASLGALGMIGYGLRRRKAKGA